MSVNILEQKLVTRAGQGDRDAFGDLYELYLDDLYHYVYYRVNNHQDAEDLVEAIFIKAWQSVHRCLAEKAPFKAWLYRIAHNTIIDYYRTRKEIVPLTEQSPIVDEQVDLETTLMYQQEAIQLTQVMAELSPLHQHVLTLRFIQGMSMAEVAGVLERTEGAVRVLQHRALKALHASLVAKEVINV